MYGTCRSNTTANRSGSRQELSMTAAASSAAADPRRRLMRGFDHVHALPGTRQATPVIRNRRPACSRPPLSTAPPADQSTFLRHAGSVNISWFVYFRGLRARRTRIRRHLATARLPARQPGRRSTAAKPAAKTTASYRRPATGLEHRPSGRPPLDRPGQSAHACGSKGPNEAIADIGRDGRTVYFGFPS